MRCSLTAAAFVAAGGLVKAAPASSVVASYDDITANPVEPPLNQIPKPYKGLCYNAFVVGNNTLATYTVPHSLPNQVASDEITRLMQGTPALSTTTCATSVKSFAVTSFWTGCAVLGGQAIASAPVACTLQATGTRKGSTQTVTQTFNYKPSALVKAPMQQFKLQGFTDLERMAVTLPVPAQNAAFVFHVDDVATALAS